VLTTKFRRYNGWVKQVNGKRAPKHLIKLRIPPAWTGVQVDPDSDAVVMAIGTDAAGRTQRLYSASHMATAKDVKFTRVRELLAEWADIRTQIEWQLNDKTVPAKDREAYMVAYLIYETGIRPGSNVDTLADVQAFGATTLQLRHVKQSPSGVRLRFVGKKGVKQNVLVTNPYLVRVMLKRKRSNHRWSSPLFNVSATKLRQVFRLLGSGKFVPKDFRTALGTSIALEIFEKRKRWPKTKKAQQQIVNHTLDKVAKQLGNTRAISRSAYVDPTVLDEFTPK